MCSWILSEYGAKFDRDPVSAVVTDKVAQLKDKSDDVMDLIHVLRPLAEYSFVMHLFVYLVCTLLALSFAFSFTVWSDTACWQPIPVFSTFIVCWIYFALINICDTLKFPFLTAGDTTSDRLNPEAVICAVDLELFRVMRQGFTNTAKFAVDEHRFRQSNGSKFQSASGVDEAALSTVKSEKSSGCFGSL